MIYKRKMRQNATPKQQNATEKEVYTSSDLITQQTVSASNIVILLLIIIIIWY